MAAVWLLLVGGWCFQPHSLPWLGACLLLDQAPCSGQWEGNKQHEDIILAIYPVSLVLSKILQSVKCKGSRPLKLQLKYLQKRQ